MRKGAVSIISIIKCCPVLLVGCCILTLAACDSSPIPTDTSTIATKSSGGYPRPNNDPYPFPSSRPLPARTPIAPVDAPTPISGKASVSGILYSVRISFVIPDTQYFLKRVPADSNNASPLFGGPDETAGDILARSDAQAYVRLNNLSPGDYHLAVWYAYTWIPAIASRTDSNPLVIHLEPNQRAVLGVIHVPWP